MSRKDKISLACLGLGAAAILVWGTAAFVSPMVEAHAAAEKAKDAAEKANRERVAAEARNQAARQAQLQARLAARNDQIAQIVAQREQKLSPQIIKQNRGPNIRVRVTETRLYVTSYETNELWALTFYINGQPPFTWRHKVGPIPPHEEFFVSLNEFTKKDGRRFNPFEYKVTEIWAGGDGFDYAGFSP
jgi:hypothetical protein